MTLSRRTENAERCNDSQEVSGGSRASGALPTPDETSCSPPSSCGALAVARGAAQAASGREIQFAAVFCAHRELLALGEVLRWAVSATQVQHRTIFLI